MEENTTIVQQCKKCPAGFFAPKVQDLCHFEGMPPQLKASCDVATNIGNHKDCSTHRGWHTTSDFFLQSSSPHHGIPQGLKFSLKTYINVINPSGGRLVITYKMVNFKSSKEYLRVLINGMLEYTRNMDTAKLDTVINLGPKNSNDTVDDFVYIESEVIPYGNNSIEISVISEFDQY